MRFFVVGAGIYGSVIANLVATRLNEPVTVFERRQHIGGNCHSQIDPATGIECHMYGSHIFHTSIPAVMDYLKNFMTLTSYRHKVLTKHAGRTFFLPMNLSTVNDLYGRDFSPAEAREFLAAEIAGAGISNPANFEEKAISLIGRPLYEAFFKNYTKKQWDRDPSELPAAIITRLPVRLNYNIDYFSDTWQGVPKEGYFTLFRNLLDHPNITVELDTDYAAIKERIPQGATVVYTGMPDELFDYRYGALEWRSLRFEWETLDVPDFQGTTVMNYADLDPAFTRIHEFKHYHPERSEVFSSQKTVICREYPATFHKGGEAYYPINDARNNDLYALYAAEAAKIDGLILGGRLGSYRYWDMDKAVAAALETFETKLAHV